MNNILIYRGTKVANIGRIQGDPRYSFIKGTHIDKKENILIQISWA